MKKESLHYIWFLLLSVAVMGPLLMPGYIITLDMVPSMHPWKAVSEDFSSSEFSRIRMLPFHILYAIGSTLLTPWLFQKLMLFGILFISGVSAYNLCPGNRWGKLFAGTLYMINPVIFVRFMAGHFLLLLGYAIMPILAKSLLELAKNGSRKNTLKASLLLTAEGMVYLQSFFISGIFIIAVLLFNRRKETVLSFARTALLFLMLNLYWIPFMLISPADTGFVDESHLLFFSSQQSLDFNSVFMVTSMHGFWRGGYTYGKDIISFWPILFAAILFLSVHGYISCKDRRLAGIFGLTALSSAVIAVGISSEYFRPVYLFLYNSVPFFESLREPHKFVGLLALCYSFLGGIGLSKITENIRKREALIVAGISIMAVLLYSLTMLNGFLGQLETQFYPEEYSEADKIMEEGKVLYLPWHNYMSYTWTKQRIAAPAGAVFSNTVINGPSEWGGVSEDQKAVGGILSKYYSGNYNTGFGSEVQNLGARYVVLDRSFIAPVIEYEFLYNQTDLDIVHSGDFLDVWEVKITSVA